MKRNLLFIIILLAHVAPTLAQTAPKDTVLPSGTSAIPAGLVWRWKLVDGKLTYYSSDVTTGKTRVWLTGQQLDYYYLNKSLAATTYQPILGFTPANDALVLHKAGNETITGIKTFTSNININNPSGLGINFTGGSEATFTQTGTNADTWYLNYSASFGGLLFSKSAQPGFIFSDNGLIKRESGSTVTDTIATQAYARLQRGTGTVTGVSGTTNRITSSGGPTPAIDISAAYIGQSSITTLGTIIAGIWHGTPITDSYISSAAIWNAKQKTIVAGANITIAHGASADTINATGGGGGGSGTTTYPLNIGPGLLPSSSFNGSASVNLRVDTTNIATRGYVNSHVSDSTYYVSKIINATPTANLAIGSTTYGTDYTSQIQAYLNRAQLHPIKLIFDVAVSTTGWTVYANTYISATPNTGAILRSAANKAIFKNAHFNITGALADSNITIDGGTWNFNGANQSHDTPGEGLVTGFRFAGVKNLVIKNAHLYMPRTYTVWLVNGDRTLLSQNEVITARVLNTDGFHFNGPYTNIVVEKNYLNCGDDAVAINADEVLVSYSPFPDTHGPISNVIIRDNTFVTYGVRLLSGASRLDNVSITGNKGTAQPYFVVSDNFNQNPSVLTAPGNGNFGSIYINDNDVNVFNDAGIGAYITKSFYNFYGKYDHVTLNNSSRRKFAYNAPFMVIDSAYTSIKVLEILSHASQDTAGTNSNPFIKMGSGNIDRLILSNITHSKPTDIDAPLLLKTGGTIGSIEINNIKTNHILNPIKQTGGSIGSIAMSNTNMTDSDTSKAFIANTSSTAIKSVKSFGSNLRHITNGLVTLMRSDTAFQNGGSYTNHNYDFTIDKNIGVNSTSGGNIRYTNFEPIVQGKSHIFLSAGRNDGDFNGFQLGTNDNADHFIYLLTGGNSGVVSTIPRDTNKFILAGGGSGSGFARPFVFRNYNGIIGGPNDRDLMTLFPATQHVQIGGISGLDHVDNSFNYTLNGAGWAPGTLNIGSSVTGSTSGGLTISKTTPQISLEATTAGTNNKTWDFIADQYGNFTGRAVNDANTVATTWLNVNRTGTTVNGVSMPEPVTANSFIKSGADGNHFLVDNGVATSVDPVTMTGHVADLSNAKRGFKDSITANNQNITLTNLPAGDFAIQIIFTNPSSHTGTTINGSSSALIGGGITNVVIQRISGVYYYVASQNGVNYARKDSSAQNADNLYYLANKATARANLGAQTLLSLTTTGTGAATLNPTTGALNIPTSSSGYSLPSLTQGSVIFKGATDLSQDNANFFWDATNHRLGIGTNSPGAVVHSATTDGTGVAFRMTGTGSDGNNDGTNNYGADIVLLHNTNGNRQTFFGDSQVGKGVRFLHYVPDGRSYIDGFDRINNVGLPLVVQAGGSSYFGVGSSVAGPALNWLFTVGNNVAGIDGSGYHYGTGYKIGSTLVVGQSSGNVYFQTPGNSFIWNNAAGSAQNMTLTNAGILTVPGGIASGSSNQFQVSSFGNVSLPAGAGVSLTDGAGGSTTLNGYAAVGGNLTQTLQAKSGIIADLSDITNVSGTVTTTAGTGAGTSPTISISRQGNHSLQVTVTTGTTPAASANIVTLTLPSTLIATPSPVYSDAADNGTTNAISVDGTDSTHIVLKAKSTPLTASTTYKWNIIF